jgi:ribosomal protein S18 acetylase RimI-like enzyme
MPEKSAVPALTIRRARPEDDVALGELLVAAYVTAYEKKMPQVVLPEQRKTDLRAVAEKRKHAIVLVVEEDGELLGTVSLWPQDTPGSEAWLPNACDLRHLATAPSAHGRGLSKPLLDEAERVAREELRSDAICLHVRRGNEGVRRLYEKRGYVRDEAGDLELPAVSLMAFAKKLSAASRKLHGP